LTADVESDFREQAYGLERYDTTHQLVSAADEVFESRARFTPLNRAGSPSE
jgi:hypothetical protein